MNKYAWILLALALCSAPAAQAELASTTQESLPEAAASSTPPAQTEPAASTTPAVPPPPEAASTTPPAPSPAPAPAPEPDPVSIMLAIETAGATLFSGPVAASACAPRAGLPSEITGYCALEQSGVKATWSWWGDDAFLDSLGGITNDNTNGVYWMWFSDLEMGSVALNRHALKSGESLLITLGKMPLRLDFEAHPALGSATTISVLAFGFDESYNPVWLPAAGAEVHVGSQSFVADASGLVLYVASTTDPLEIYASKDGFVPTSRSTIAPVAPAPAPEPAEAVPEGGGGGAKKRPGSAAEALSFLLAEQRADGSFGGIMQSDWAALALAGGGAPRGAKAALGDFLASAKKLTSLTDYERRAMALLALGINPHETNVIQKIVAGFDGTQMGDQDLLNDDIFALLPLLHAGYKPSDEIIVKIAAHILSSQEADGSWRYPDITSAAIQALAPLSSLEGVPAALKKAAHYLKARQGENGCFGNVFAHSWALQATLALSEPAEYWRTAQGATPQTCLAGLAQEDGGFELLGVDAQNRIWATAYALPALASKPWDALLKNFPKPKEKENISRAPNPDLSIDGIVLGAATTTAPLATSTQNPLLDIAPATPPLEPLAVPPAHIILPKKSALDAPASVHEELTKDQIIVSAPTLPHKPVIGFLLSLWQRLASLLWLL